MRSPAVFRLRTVVVMSAVAVGAALFAPNAVAADNTSGDPAERNISAEVFAALERDLGLSEAEALARFAIEDRAAEVEKKVRKQLGNDFAGAWVRPDSDKLIVAVTGTEEARKVRAAGGKATIVEHSKDDLAAQVAEFDAHKSTAPDTVTGWYPDMTTNTVVVNTKPGTTAAAEQFVAASGADPGAVRVRETEEAPRPLYDLRGGDAYYIGSSTRCSIGFSVDGGFVTAGHCGNAGNSTSGANRVAQGTFRGSSFPGNDYAWVATNSNWTPRGLVNNYAGGTVAVAGSQDAPVGSTVCRSGSTTGWHCGTIQARNASVTYPQGTITGLIRTNVCAEPGDSGGSLLSGNQAQGVTSGGSGNCSSGGTTYFQPVNEILQTYGLTLVTTGGGPGDPGDPPGGNCEGDSTYTGSLNSGGVAYQPNGQYYRSNVSGTHSGCLAGPSGADFDLYLQQWNGQSWQTVAQSASPGPDESLDYNGSAGYYRYQVHAYSGSGSYTLAASAP